MLSGKRAVRGSFLLALGAFLYTIASPPYEWTGAAWLALTPLFLVLRDKTPTTAFLAGLVYAMLWCVGVGYWMYLTIAAHFPLVFPFDVLFILANYLFYAGLCTGAVATGSCLLMRQGNPWCRWIGIPALWVSGEFIRANPLFGVSWGILGYTQYRHLPLIQIADITSVYGLSFLIALSGYLAAECVSSLRFFQVSSLKPQASKLPWPALGFLAGALALTLGYGTLRLRQYAQPPSSPALRVAVVQGNVRNAQRWQPAYYASALLKYVSVTTQGIAGSTPDLVVWPEFAVSFYLNREFLLQAQLGQFAHAAKAALLLGAPRLEESDSGARYYNSAYLFSPAGELVDVYDKIRLVPFAERSPFALPPLFPHNAAAPSEFTPGARATVFSLPHGTFGVTICYEAAYPSLTRRLVQNGAQVLVNLSNDTWLGGAAAAVEQHFAMAVFRAVENKRPLVRAATAGISGFVDPTGRPHTLSTAEETVIQGAAFPRRELTVYARYGDWFSWACVSFSLVALLSATRRHAGATHRQAQPARTSSQEAFVTAGRLLGPS